MDALKIFRETQAKIHAYSHATGMLVYDSETSMPKGAGENLGKTLAVLSEDIYKLEVSKELKDALKSLMANSEELDAQTKKEVEEVARNLEKTEKIPMEEYVEYQVARSAAGMAWQEAKAKNDYETFKPHLKKMIDFNVKFAKYVKPEEENLYNTMLDDYERGITADVLDEYFAKIRTDLVPLILKIKDMPKPRTDFLKRAYPIEGQKIIASYLMDVLCLDKNYCSLGETEHPFSTHFSNKDVRITTNFHEDNIASSFYSVIHEGGHGMYELNTADELYGTVLASGTSMGIHESQSRFWENIVGRSLEFINLVFPKLKEVFPEQLEDVTAQEFYKAINKAEPSLIRIEADELTYSMHIMIRYEIEKLIIGGKIGIDELPAQWNKLYKEYLGVDVPSDDKGILQDVHWSMGMFGYFPSYSIGSAYASQIAKSMEKDIDIKALIVKGELQAIVDWLTEHVYKYGSLLNPKEVINVCCGTDFDPNFYVDYLTEKYTKLYNL